jgi:dTDP-4-dehydrorhamnose reductase
LFIDEFRTPVSGEAAAEGMLIALERLPGMIHLGGPERISRYGFGRLLAEVLHVPGAKLNPCRQKDIPMSAPRPPDVSLDSSKANYMGFRPYSLRRELERLRNADLCF